MRPRKRVRLNLLYSLSVLYTEKIKSKQQIRGGEKNAAAAVKLQRIKASI
jgi:hypothetical protein